MVGKAAPPAGLQPFIPEQYLDVPSQRLYYLSLGLLLQVSGIQLDKFCLCEVAFYMTRLVYVIKTSLV